MIIGFVHYILKVISTVLVIDNFNDINVHEPMESKKGRDVGAYKCCRIERNVHSITSHYLAECHLTTRILGLAFCFCFFYFEVASQFGCCSHCAFKMTCQYLY